MYVITGASDGVGLALAKVLASKDVRVVSLSRNKPRAKGVEHIACDLMNEGSIIDAAEALLRQKEAIHALVNCAGVFGREPMNALTGREIARIFTTNIIGPMLLTSRLLERIKKDGADIVNMSSTAGHKGSPDWAAYSTSKWAMRGFSKNLQAELAGTPCRVVDLSPGGIKTDLFGKSGADMPGVERYMEPQSVAEFIAGVLALPKNMQLSEATLNRK